MERVTRIERATFSLATKGSTAELHPHLVFTSYIIYFVCQSSLITDNQNT